MTDSTSEKQSRVNPITDFGKQSFVQLREKFSSQDWTNIGFNAVVILSLASIAMLVRILAAYYFREYYPLNNTYTMWNRDVVFSPNNIPLEGFFDFRHFYLNWANAWYTTDWNPFPRWQETAANMGDPLYLYSYPPIFLYILLSIWRPGMVNFWIAFPLILSDALCSGVIFLIIKNIFKDKFSNAYAIFGGLLFAFSPINVIYNGVYWLNPGPVTLFTLLAFYFVIKKKWAGAFFWLAIATMTKQNALFFTFPIFFMMLGSKLQDNSIKKTVLDGVLIILLFLFVCFICSIPWIFIDPINYGAHLLFPGKRMSFSTIIVIPEYNNTIEFSYSLMMLGFSGWFLDFIALGINSMFFMIISASAIAVIILWRSYNKKMDTIEFFEWMAVYMIVTHIFMPRGVYKFYSAYYTSLILIAILSSLAFNTKTWKTSIIAIFGSALLFIGFSISHLLVLRVFTPAMLFLLVLVIITFLVTRMIFKSKYLKKRNTFLRTI
ncbi:MAG: glycosyltransferase family 39 protein [Candidatus Heimdallarchaeota archaeon]